MAKQIPNTVEAASQGDAELIDTLRETNRLLAERTRTAMSWKLALRNALLAGLGGAIGATLLVSLLVYILKPFAGISPILQRISDDLQHVGQKR